MYHFNLDDVNPGADESILQGDIDPQDHQTEKDESVDLAYDHDLNSHDREEELFNHSAKSAALKRKRSEAAKRRKENPRKKNKIGARQRTDPQLARQTSITISIDFGSTHSGSSYQTNQFSGRNEVFTFHNYPGDPSIGGVVVKIPSLIAYRSENQGWGPDKRKLRKDVIGYEVKPGMKFYACTKLLLDEEVNLGELDDHLLQTNIGASFLQLPAGKSAEAVVTDFLRLFCKMIMQQLVDRYGEEYVKNTTLRYFVTTPAQWSDKAVDRTVRAVKAAGFPANRKPTISTVSEPIAGALAALVGMKDKTPDVLDAIKTCMIIDGGGGTIDLEVLGIEQTPKLRIREILSGEGAKCGSTAVDRQFISFMQERFGEYFELLDEADRGPTSSLMTHFEDAKKRFAGDLDDMIRIGFPALKNSLLTSITKIEGYDMRNGEIVLTGEEMAGFFEKTIKAIFEMADNLLNSLKERESCDPDAIIFVGGLANSRHVWHAVQHHFRQKYGDSIRILRPDDPWGAVSYGAVLFGLENEVRVSRVARRHYGVEVSRSFQDGDPIERAFSCPLYARRAGEEVSWLIRKSEQLKNSQGTPMKTINGYLALTSIATKDLQFSWDVYCCDSDNAPKYVDDAGVDGLGKLQIDLTDWKAKQSESVLRRVSQHTPYKLRINLKLTGGEGGGKVSIRAVVERKEVGRYILNYMEE